MNIRIFPSLDLKGNVVYYLFTYNKNNIEFLHVFNQSLYADRNPFYMSSRSFVLVGPNASKEAHTSALLNLDIQTMTNVKVT